PVHKSQFMYPNNTISGVHDDPDRLVLSALKCEGIHTFGALRFERFGLRPCFLFLLFFFFFFFSFPSPLEGPPMLHTSRSYSFSSASHEGYSNFFLFLCAFERERGES